MRWLAAALLFAAISGSPLAQGAASTGALPARPEAADAISAEALTTGSATGPWPMSAFVQGGDAQPARIRFEGRLVLEGTLANETFQVLVDRYGDGAGSAPVAATLPPFDFEFVQVDDALVPVRRGPQASAHPQWEWVLEPGRVWSSARDAGMSRAALPFALQERNANCLHNGVLTFLFDAHGGISHVALEVAQETCAYFQFNLSAMSAASYRPGAVAGAEALRAHYRAEVAARMPVQPIAALAQRFHGVRSERFGSPQEVAPEAMSTYGLVVDGVHYVGGCRTRFGEFPWCDVMDLPSYSLAKSIVGGLGGLQLEHRYPGILDEPIARWVPECARAGGWDDVRIRDALDMATGHWNSTVDQADEDAADIVPFFLAIGHVDKATFACTHYPRRAAPGKTWVYHSTDFYLAGAALNAVLHARAPGSDLYRSALLEPIFQPLHLSPVLDDTRRTLDDVRQSFTAYGLTLHRDDIARLARYIASKPGALPGLDTVLQRDAKHRGLKAATQDFRYSQGFWAWNAQGVLGCAQPLWIPFMSGYGGIIVALLPNDMIYYYFSDGGQYAWSQAVQEADRMRPMCKRPR